MAYLVKQIKNVVNDSVKDALGKTNGVTAVETTDFISLGKMMSTYDLYEGFFSALVNRLMKTIYFIRSYEGRARTILRDEHEYGAFIQKVYYEMPEAVDNSTWDIPDTNGDYHQHSPYDVEGTITVTGAIFGGQGTWAVEIIRPIEQIKTAFTSETEMMKFIDGIYITLENKYKLDEERLIADAVNTSMANELKGGHSRNLLSEYNTLSSANLTVAEAMTNADFIKYANKEISRTIDNMRIMSTAYNKSAYATFTDRENLVVEMLSEYAKASEVYLESDTFHNDLVALPNYESVPFWQSSGNSFAFADTSKISVNHDDINNGTTVTQSGIICFIHDIENVACYFGNRKSWELLNPRDEVMIHGEKARKGFAVDSHANAVVFYLA